MEPLCDSQSGARPIPVIGNVGPLLRVPLASSLGCSARLLTLSKWTSARCSASSSMRGPSAFARLSDLEPAEEIEHFVKAGPIVEVLATYFRMRSGP